jgi:hypothetical protein
MKEEYYFAYQTLGLNPKSLENHEVIERLNSRCVQNKTNFALVLQCWLWN